MREDTMKRILWILAAAGICLVAAAALLGEQAAEKSGEEAAKAWLVFVDAGRYAESWKQAAAMFQGRVTQEQWEKTVGSVRGSIGQLVSRKLKASEFSRTMPGAPDGEYVAVQYDSVFENKRHGLETVVTMKEKDGSWKVAGYFIK